MRRFSVFKSCTKKECSFQLTMPCSIYNNLEIRKFMVSSKIYLSAINNEYSISYLISRWFYLFFFLAFSLSSFLWSSIHLLVHSVISFLFRAIQSIRIWIFSRAWATARVAPRTGFASKKSRTCVNVQEGQDEIMIRWCNCVVIWNTHLPSYII